MPPPPPGGPPTAVQRALINPDGSLNAWQLVNSDRSILPLAPGYSANPYIYQDFIYLLSGFDGHFGAPPVQGIAQGTIR